MRTIYANAEVAGVIQSEIDRQGLGGELEAKRHPYMPHDLIAVADADDKPSAIPLALVMNARAGLRVLLA